MRLAAAAASHQLMPKTWSRDFSPPFLDDRALKKADPHRGRFRTFLLSSLENFMANECDRATAAKRGGKFHFVSLQELELEERHAAGAADQDSAQEVFERRQRGRATLARFAFRRS